MCYVKMNSRRLAINLCVVFAIVFGLVIHILPAFAETPYDITNCYNGTRHDLYRTKELVATRTDVVGISRSNIENKAFDMSDSKSNATEVASSLGITRSSLYDYVNGDGSLKELGKQLLDG